MPQAARRTGSSAFADDDTMISWAGQAKRIVSASSRRKPTHTPRLFNRAIGLPPSATTDAGGYGPRLSPGRRQRVDRRSPRPEHELAVALEVGAGPHIELPVLADEEQRALRHLLRALQQQAGI